MKYFISLLLILPAYLPGHSQGNDIPNAVMKTFKAKFPAAAKTEWERKGDIYQAEFEIGRADHKACFDETGRLTIYKMEIPVAELPAPVLKAIRKQYKGYTIDDVDKVDKSGKIYYQVELDGRPADAKVIFSPDGAILNDEAFW